ncbi:recombinase RecT [Paraburkholderia atlantica]|uniref:recombinase RecT n=1 Tax=Paraburkholderia atlantica TaxID=2654982 RepID=UPI0018521EE1|nr:recombinase RecT [Paraburkholderia atlantica]MBB5508103.1 recombination protein RecT [Paraburkholderia atlantica]
MSVDRSINFEREAGFAIQILANNDYALGIAMSNKQSVIDAVTNISAIGISLNPAKKQAYLVPRDRKICLDLSYIGLLDLAVASGSIMWGKAELVKESDDFRLNGFDKPPVHERNPFAKDRGEVVGVYVVAKTHSGDYLTETMTIDEVNDIRNRSSAWKAWTEKKKSCPWVTDPGEMAKKTVIKRASKTWPKADRLDKAIHFLNTDGEEGLETIRQQSAVVAGCPEEVLSAWCAKAKTATSEAALSKIWTDGLAVIKPYKDVKSYDTFKAVVSARGGELKQKPADANTIDVQATEVKGAQREPGADDELEADFQRQMAKENAA